MSNDEMITEKKPYYTPSLVAHGGVIEQIRGGCKGILDGYGCAQRYEFDSKARAY